MTNHIWGGDRMVQRHFSVSPIYWGSPDGLGTVNYVFTDGSLRQYHLTRADVPSKTNKAINFGIGTDAYILPREWGR